MQQKQTLLEAELRLLQATECTGTLILDFPTFKIVSNIYFSCSKITQSVTVISAGADEQTETPAMNPLCLKPWNKDSLPNL